MKKRLFFTLLAVVAMATACVEKEKSNIVTDFYINNQTGHFLHFDFCGKVFDTPDTMLYVGVSVAPFEAKRAFSLYTINTGYFNRYDDPSYYDSVVVYVNSMEIGSVGKDNGLLRPSSYKLIEENTKVIDGYEHKYWEFTIDQEFLDGIERKK